MHLLFFMFARSFLGTSFRCSEINLSQRKVVVVKASAEDVEGDVDAMGRPARQSEAELGEWSFEKSLLAASKPLHMMTEDEDSGCFWVFSDKVRSALVPSPSQRLSARQTRRPTRRRRRSCCPRSVRL